MFTEANSPAQETVVTEKKPHSRRLKSQVPLSERKGRSISETAAYDGIDRSTMFKLIQEGKGPRVTKIRRRRIVTDEDNDDWLRSMAEVA